MGTGIAWRAVLLVAAIITLTAGGTGCDNDDDRLPNRVDVTLRPGEPVSFTFQITVDESEEADYLLSCDFVDIVSIDPGNLAADIEYFGQSGSFDCAVHLILAARPDAIPGDYEVRVRFYYTYYEDGFIDDDDTDGYISVSVVK